MRVGLIGAGDMARALARGWADPVLCCDAGVRGAFQPGIDAILAGQPR